MPEQSDDVPAGPTPPPASTSASHPPTETNDPVSPIAAKRSEAPSPSPPIPLLDYSNRAPPPLTDTAVMDLVHGLVSMGLYLGMILAMKYAAMRWRWDVGGICGVWVTILVISLGLAGWLYGAYGFRGVMTGTLVAILISLIAAPLLLGGS